MNLSDTSTRTSTNAAGLGIRKRVDSNVDESFESYVSVSPYKRPRLSAMAFPSSRGRLNSIGVGADRLPKPPLSIFNDIEGMSNGIFHYSPTGQDRPTSSNSSFTAGSRSASPFVSADFRPQHTGSSNSPGLIRSASSTSLRMSPIPFVYPESSAKFFLRSPRTIISYMPPPSSDDIVAKHLTCSANNAVFFTRGNRVHFKNLNSNYHEDIGQLCKLSISQGNIRSLDFNSKSQPEVLAIGTTKGVVQLWDVQAKKMTVSWTSVKEITAMTWNGPLLTVGGVKGHIRHYDSRVPASKIKEQARRSIRHEAPISALLWSVDGKVLASGDATGTVFCWKDGFSTPMQVGEIVKRRKKIVQSGKISAVSWCPWDPKILATGDAGGILRLWNVNDRPGSNALSPGKLDTASVITGIHFSPHCKEILTAHGPRIGAPVPIDPCNPKPSSENALVVHSFPSLRHVTTFRLPIERGIGDTLLDSTGTKIIFATPSDGKINVSDVWAKRKEVKREAIKRQGSMLSLNSRSSSYSLIR